MASGPFHPAWLRCLKARLADESGVTLIELLTVMLTLGIVFSASFFFYSTTLARTGDTEARRDVLDSQRVALENIAREVREAQSIDSPAAGHSGNSAQLTLLSASGATSTVTIDCSAGNSCTQSTATGGSELLIDGLQASSNPVFTVGSTGSYVLIRFEALPDGRTRPIVLSRGIALRNCAQDPEADQDCRD